LQPHLFFTVNLAQMKIAILDDYQHVVSSLACFQLLAGQDITILHHTDKEVDKLAAEWLHMPNVVCTPHLGYVEKESYELYFGKAFENVMNFINGHPTNIANP